MGATISVVTGLGGTIAAAGVLALGLRGAGVQTAVDVTDPALAPDPAPGANGGPDLTLVAASPLLSLTTLGGITALVGVVRSALVVPAVQVLQVAGAPGTALAGLGAQEATPLASAGVTAVALGLVHCAGVRMGCGAAPVFAVDLTSAVAPVLSRATAGAYQAARLTALRVTIRALDRTTVPREVCRALDVCAVDVAHTDRPTVVPTELAAFDTVAATRLPGTVLAASRPLVAGGHVGGITAIVVAVEGTDAAPAPLAILTVLHTVVTPAAARRLLPTTTLVLRLLTTTTLSGVVFGAAGITTVDVLEDATSPTLAAALLDTGEAALVAPTDRAWGTLLFAGVGVEIEAGSVLAAHTAPARQPVAALADLVALDATAFALLPLTIPAVRWRRCALPLVPLGAVGVLAVDPAVARGPEAVHAGLLSDLAAGPAILALTGLAVHRTIGFSALVGVGCGALGHATGDGPDTALSPFTLDAAGFPARAVVTATDDITRLANPVSVAFIRVALGTRGVATVDVLHVAAAPLALHAKGHTLQATISAGPTGLLFAGRPVRITGPGDVFFRSNLATSINESLGAPTVGAVQPAFASGPDALVARLAPDYTGDRAAPVRVVLAGARAFALAFAFLTLTFPGLALAFPDLALAFPDLAFALTSTFSLALALGGWRIAIGWCVGTITVAASGQRHHEQGRQQGAER